MCVLRFRTADEERSETHGGGLRWPRRPWHSQPPAALGDAIHAMAGLIHSGLRSGLHADTEIGLPGDCWLSRIPRSHRLVNSGSRGRGKFDFSAQGERLEVKTTTGAARVHWFSSGQLGPIRAFGRASLP